MCAVGSMVPMGDFDGLPNKPQPQIFEKQSGLLLGHMLVDVPTSNPRL